jgi:hypothetical protein
VGNFARQSLFAVKERRAFGSPLLKSSLVAVFSALSLATNYAMISIVNVKLMDVLVFISAFLFGVEVGIGTAIVTWGIYGFVNPYGQDGFPLIAFLMAGECFYAIAAGILRRTSLGHQLREVSSGSLSSISADRSKGSYLRSVVLFGVVGFLATFAYDLITNFATYLFVETSVYQAFVIGTITGVPFSVLHELSNLVFFALVAPGVIVAARDLPEGRLIR